MSKAFDLCMDEARPLLINDNEEEKTLNWVKASFDKQGKWEYKIISID